MDLRQLKYFTAIVDSGSLTKAAERVYVAQSALSQRISALEAELKTPLLIRNPHGVTPTAAGKALYRHARTVLRELEQARQAVLNPDGDVAGQVSLGVPATLGPMLALPLVTAVRERFPGIHVHLCEGTGGYLAELLAHGRLDMSIQLRDSPTAGTAVVPLVDDRLFLFGEPAGGNPGDECPLGALANQPLMLMGAAHGHGLRMIVERSFQEAGVALNVVADVDSVPALLAAARAGIACTILPCTALPVGAADGPRRRLIVTPNISRPVSLCWATSIPRTDAAHAVQGLITEVVSRLVETGAWAGAGLREPAD